MKRRLLNLLAVASLAASLLLGIVWPYSYWRADSVYYLSGDRESISTLGFGIGRLVLTHLRLSQKSVGLPQSPAAPDIFGTM